MSEQLTVQEQSAPSQEATLRTGKVTTPKQFSQLGLLVVDGSGSMTESAVGNVTKAQATNSSIRELFTRFKASRAAKNFTFAVVTFDAHATVRLQPTEVAQLDDNGDYNPLNGHGGGTQIYSALEEAERVVDSFLGKAPADGVAHTAVILVMSDGCCSNPTKTVEVANRIKTLHGSRVKICSTLFASVGNKDVAGETLLKQMASDPVMGYKTVYDGESLRNFFERSISSASGGVHIV